jgi:carbon storage regulator
MATAGRQQQRPTASNPGKSVVGAYFDGQIVQERRNRRTRRRPACRDSARRLRKDGRGVYFQPYQGGSAMLVLTRRVGEEIMIGDDVRLTVVVVMGNKVRIGITAPSVVQVCRGEILSRVTRPNVPEVASIHS